MRIQTVTWDCGKEANERRYKRTDVTLAFDQIDNRDLTAMLVTTLMHIMQYSSDRQHCLQILKERVRDYYWSQIAKGRIRKYKNLRDILPTYVPLAMTTRSFKWRKTIFVAPNMFRQVKKAEWYEHGILREWHHQRRLGVAEATRGARRYEKINDLIPSYETAGEYDDLSESGEEWESHSSSSDDLYESESELSEVDEDQDISTDEEGHEAENEPETDSCAERDDRDACERSCKAHSGAAGVAVHVCANEEPQGVFTDPDNDASRFLKLQEQQGSSSAQTGTKRKRTD